MLDEPKQVVAQARRDFAELAAGWRAVSAASARRARDQAEVQVFNQMAVALAGRFCGAQGAAAMELRLLVQGIGTDGRFPVAVGWRPDISVTGYGAGDRIALTEAVFSGLAEVFLDGVARQMA